MIDMDVSGLLLCDIQADLFVASLEYTNMSSAVFIRRFMNSDLSKRFDNCGLLCEATCNIGLIDELNEEYGKCEYGNNKYTKEELHWIGYIYRYFTYILDESSKYVYKIVKPDELKKYYYQDSNIVPEELLNIILEKKNFKKDFKEFYYERK